MIVRVDIIIGLLHSSLVMANRKEFGMALYSNTLLIVALYGKISAFIFAIPNINFIGIIKFKLICKEKNIQNSHENGLHDRATNCDSRRRK